MTLLWFCIQVAQQVNLKVLSTHTKEYLLRYFFWLVEIVFIFAIMYILVFENVQMKCMCIWILLKLLSSLFMNWFKWPKDVNQRIT